MSTAVPVSTASAVTRPVRLTRRGRLLVVALVLMALSAVGSLVGHTVASADAPATARHVTVRSGETLWELANRIAPHADPRVVVARIEAANHLSNAGVVAGQRLVVSGVAG